MKTLCVAVTCLLAFVMGCSKTEAPETADLAGLEMHDAKTHASMVDRGAYLVTIMLCHDCHSPKVFTDKGPEPDPTRLLSGHPADETLPVIADQSILADYVLFSMGFTAAVGEWGTSFAANLTPDDTGLGNWTFEHFQTALRHGKFKGLKSGRDLLPPMPWQMFQRLSDEDMRSIFAYLQSLPPVNNIVPAAIAPLS